MINNKIKDQKQFCEKLGVSMFIPEDGKCWFCDKDIMDKFSETECACKIITGCPFCNRSFVE